MVEIDTLFQTKTAEKKTLLRRTYPYSLYKGLPPPPPLPTHTPRGEKRVAGDESRCLRKRD